MIFKVNSDEALAESENRLQVLTIMFAGIIFIVLVGMTALWFFGSSKRATEAAENFEKLAKRFQGQRDFMHLVTDSQPNAIMILDEEGHYRWFNAVALKMSGLARGDLFDKHVAAVLGPLEGKRMAGWIKECLDKDGPVSVTHSMDIHGTGEVVYRSDFIPLPAREDFPPGVLLVSQDISDSVRERERREQVMRQLVGTLVSVVDQRDPFSANHSVRVGEVSQAIAKEMGLEKIMVETAAIAGSLMNLGKIMVPSELLTKTGKLTDEEISQIQNSILISGKLVQDIDFDGPVSQTLLQLLENFDGSGVPSQISGEGILVSARVSAVSNAFVGMVSARAWREGMPFDKALDILLQDGNKKFDRKVVVALANYLDNRGGREEWISFGERLDA
jgi:PAS domain S-box-containing protein